MTFYVRNFIGQQNAGFSGHISVARTKFQGISYNYCIGGQNRMPVVRTPCKPAMLDRLFSKLLFKIIHTNMFVCCAAHASRHVTRPLQWSAGCSAVFCCPGCRAALHTVPGATSPGAIRPVRLKAIDRLKYEQDNVFC